MRIKGENPLSGGDWGRSGASRVRQESLRPLWAKYCARARHIVPIFHRTDGRARVLGPRCKVSGSLEYRIWPTVGQAVRIPRGAAQIILVAVAFRKNS